MCYENKTHSPSAPLRCDIFENVTIMPQLTLGILHQKSPMALFACGAFSQEQAISQAHGIPGLGKVSAQIPYFKATQNIDQEVIYGGEFLGYFGHWGHFLTETLQRLWYAQHKDLPIAWLMPVDDYQKTTSYYTATHEKVFHDLGITNEHILITSPTQFRKVHFPEPGLGISGYAHPDHINFLGYHEGKVQKGKFVYLSRSRYNNCLNEKKLETLLNALGWHIAFPEELSITEQLNLLTTSEVCMMISGSAQHSLLLTKNSQTRFIVIPRIHSTLYNTISKYKSDNYYLLNINKNILNSGTSTNNNKFTLDLDELEKLLIQTHNFTANLSTFPSKIKHLNNIAENYTNIPESYYSKDCSVTPVEEFFYQAIFFYKEHKYKEAHKILMHLYNKKLLEFYMYDYFFHIIEAHDTHYKVQTPLTFTKKHFLLERAKKDLSCNPSNAEFHTALALQFLDIGQIESAIKILQTSIKKFPQWAQPYAILAHISLLQKNSSQAQLYAQKAFRLDPFEPQIKKILKACMRMQGKKT